MARDTCAGVQPTPSNRSTSAGSCGSNIPDPTEIVITASASTGRMTRMGVAAEPELSRGLGSIMFAHPYRLSCLISVGSEAPGDTPQMAATALASRSRTCPATACSPTLSIACIEATGSTALTSTPPSTARRMTLHGSIAPTRGSIPMA